MDQVQAIYDQLHAEPHNWDLRLHLIEMLLQQEQGDLAHQVLSEAPEIPEHSYDILVQWGMLEMPAQAAEAAPVVPIPEPTIPEPSIDEPTGIAEPTAFEAPTAVEPVVEAVEYAEPQEAIEPVIPVASLDRTAAHQVAPVAPLVDPNSIPEAPALKIDNVEHENNLNFVHGEELGQTRKHLAVYSGDGVPIDADLLDDDDYGYDDDEPVIMVAEGGYKPQAVAADDTKEKVGAVLTTLLVHAAIAVLLYFIVIAIPAEKPPEITAVTIPSTNEQKVTKKQLPRAVQKTPAAPANQSAAVVTAQTSANVSVPTVEITEISDTVDLGSSIGTGFGFGSGTGLGSGAFAVPSAMKSRCTTAERARMREKYGGRVNGDKAIKKALAYLKTVQNPNGSWGDGKYDAAMTGLALLSYLGYCITPDDPEYGETVMKGIMFLVEFYEKEKRLYATSTDHGASYEHGIATYALGETYAIARLGKRKLPGMKDAFEEGVQTIIDGQNQDGGWTYGHRGVRGPSDTSVTGWQYQALKAAMHTKLNFNGLNKAIKQTQQYLDDNQDRNNGMFPYRGGGPGKSTLTGAGVLGLQMLGGDDYEDEIEKGLDAIIRDMKGKSWANANLYEWYYNTQACFEGGGKHWKEWNGMFQDEIIDNQNKDGSWTSGRTNHGGKNIYTTALCTLMLEVYYRYNVNKDN